MTGMKKINPTAALCMRIRQHLAAMPPVEKKLAEMILEFPGNLASHSASEITGMAGVSNAAMTRLVKRIGYDNYDHMRRLARDGVDSGSPLFLLDGPVPGEGPGVLKAPGATGRGPGALGAGKGPGASVQGLDAPGLHRSVSIANIDATFSAISAADIDAIARAIAQAPRVGMFGQRNSHFFAGYLRWQLIQFRPQVDLLPGAGETLAEHLAGFGPRDVVILFGLRRRVALTGQLIAAIHLQGARTLLITDAGNVQDMGASWVLRCATGSAVALDNHAAVMALCHLLAASVQDCTGSAGRKRLARIEELHEVLGEFPV
jgi:DNA-binding MurR/RpiR family transcriptional regulator